jgi:DNA-binding NarL/FixJ family response regulator
MATINQGTDDTCVFLIDDHPAVREAVRDTIEVEENVTVCGEAATSDEAFRQIGDRTPDVSIVDISLADAHGLDLIQNVDGQYPDVESVVFSQYSEEAYAERAIRAGASGYVMKSEPPEQIVEAIRSVEEGELYLSQRMSSRLLNKVAAGHASDSGPVTDDLTDREMAVVQMLGQGYSVQDIQDRLNLARKTIETYRRQAKEKLGFDNVSELLQYAVKWHHTQGPGQETIAPPSPPSEEETSLGKS